MYSQTSGLSSSPLRINSEDLLDIPLKHETKKQEVVIELANYFAESATLIDNLFDALPQSETRFETLKPYQPPAGSFQERGYYESLKAFLDAVLAKCRPRNLPQLYICVYDRQMDDKIGRDEQLNPDLLGLSRPVNEDREDKVKWEEVKLAFEVKSKLGDMLAQAGTYARCMLISRPHLVFAPALVFDQKEHQLRLVFYHRGGATTTTPYSINDKDEAVSFAMAMAKLLHSATPFGEDTYMNSYCLRYDENTLLVFTYSLCRRRYIRGSATFIAEAQPVFLNGQSPTTTAGSDVYAPFSIPRVVGDVRHHTTLSTDRTSARPVRKKRVGANPSVLEAGKALAVPKAVTSIAPSLPQTLIVKVSTVRPGHGDGDVFFRTQKKMGIPTIYAYWTADQEEKYKHTGNFFPSDSHGLHKSKFESFRPSPTRSRTYTILQRGLALANAETPSLFLEAVIHAVLGHYELWKDGWLHRDVSGGNVLLLPEPEDRDGCVLWPEETSCKGILIDGDHAIKWQQQRETSLSRSGTLPFISERLLARWGEDDLVHTATDDLESFGWVIMLMLIQFSKQHYGLKKEEEMLYSSVMNTKDSVLACAARTRFLLVLNRDNAAEDAGPFINLFLPFFTSFFKILNHPYGQGGATIEQCEAAYISYLAIMRTQLALLAQEEWPHLKDASARMADRVGPMDT